MTEYSLMTVVFNTPGLLVRLLRSFRTFSSAPAVVVDNSTNLSTIQQDLKICREFNAASVICWRNIGHGPGMVRGALCCKTRYILACDSDVCFHGFEFADLGFKILGDEKGFAPCGPVDDRGKSNPRGPYRYPSPFLMFLNRRRFLSGPLPIDHGAPMLEIARHGAKGFKCFSDYPEFFRVFGKCVTHDTRSSWQRKGLPIGCRYDEDVRKKRALSPFYRR